MAELDLSGVGGLQGLPGGTVVAFRLVPYGASSSAGTWYVYDQPGYDLTLSGSQSGGADAPPPAPPPGPRPAGEGLASALAPAGRASSALVLAADGPSPVVRQGGSSAPLLVVIGPAVPTSGATEAVAPVRAEGHSLSAVDLFWALYGSAAEAGPLWR
jgi:hypothetical protein